MAPVVVMTGASLLAAALGVWLLVRSRASPPVREGRRRHWGPWAVSACAVGGVYALGAAWFDYTRHVLATAVVLHGGQVILNGVPARPGPAMEGWYWEMAIGTLIRFAIAALVCPCMLAMASYIGHRWGRRDSTRSTVSWR